MTLLPPHPRLLRGLRFWSRWQRLATTTEVLASEAVAQAGWWAMTRLPSLVAFPELTATITIQLYDDCHFFFFLLGFIFVSATNSTLRAWNARPSLNIPPPAFLSARTCRGSVPLVLKCGRR